MARGTGSHRTTDPTIAARIVTGPCLIIGARLAAGHEPTHRAVPVFTAVPVLTAVPVFTAVPIHRDWVTIADPVLPTRTHVRADTRAGLDVGGGRTVRADRRA